MLKSRNFLNYPASLLKIGFFAKIVEFFFDVYCISGEHLAFCRHLRFSWNTLNRQQNLGYLAKVLEFLELHCVTAIIWVFLPKSWNLSNYYAALLKSWSLHHCFNLECSVNTFQPLELHCIIAKNMDFLTKILKKPQLRCIIAKTLVDLEDSRISSITL